MILDMAEEYSSTTNNSTKSLLNGYEKDGIAFWVFATTYLSIALVTIVGNGMVLYASCRSQNFSRLSFFDSAIKSLAAADMFLGLVGIPCRVSGIYYTSM